MSNYRNTPVISSKPSTEERLLQIIATLIALAIMLAVMTYQPPMTNVTALTTEPAVSVPAPNSEWVTVRISWPTLPAGGNCYYPLAYNHGLLDGDNGNLYRSCYVNPFIEEQGEVLTKANRGRTGTSSGSTSSIVPTITVPTITVPDIIVPDITVPDIITHTDNGNHYGNSKPDNNSHDCKNKWDTACTQ